MSHKSQNLPSNMQNMQNFQSNMQNMQSNTQNMQSNTQNIQSNMQNMADDPNSTPYNIPNTSGLAQGYFPMQQLDDVNISCEMLKRGTIFPELDIPFEPFPKMEFMPYDYHEYHESCDEESYSKEEK